MALSYNVSWVATDRTLIYKEHKLVGTANLIYCSSDSVMRDHTKALFTWWYLKFTNHLTDCSIMFPQQFYILHCFANWA